MKSLKFFKPTLATTLAIVLAWLLSVRPAQAGYTVTLRQVGPDVVATGSGAIDLTGLTFSGSGLGAHYSGRTIGPTGLGGLLPFSISGGPVGIFTTGIDEFSLRVPAGYVSGTALSGSATYSDASTTTVEVWVQAPNPGEKLKPGTAVRVAIIAETIQNTVVAPASALLNGDDGSPKVMVITPDSVAHERKVSVGVRQGARVQILSGLQDGDQVVTSGGLGLEDKAKVSIQAAKTEDDDDDNADDAGADDKGKDAKGDAKGKKQ